MIKKRLFSMITALALCLTLLPTAARAEGGSKEVQLNGTTYPTLHAALAEVWTNRDNNNKEAAVIDLLGHEFDLKGDSSTNTDNKYNHTEQVKGVIDVPANTTFQNGTFLVTDAHAQDGIFYVEKCNAAFENVVFRGDGFTSAAGVIYVNEGHITLTDCKFDLKNAGDNISRVLGGLQPENSTFTIRNCQFTLTKIHRVFVNFSIDMSGSTVEATTELITDQLKPKTALRNITGTISNSSLTISGYDYGIENGDNDKLGNLNFKNGSSVSLSNSKTKDLLVKNGSVVVDAASTLTSDTQDDNTAVLIFDLDGGTGVTSQIIRKNGDMVDLDDYVPTRDGYTFDGWYQDTEKKEGEFKLNGRVTLTARWTAIYVPVYIPTYSVTAPAAANGTVTVTPKNAAAGVTVTITTAPKQGYVLKNLTVLDQRGNVIPLTDRGNGTYSFQMPAGNITVQAAFAPEKTVEDYFVDVPADQYYYDAVLWAVTNGITGGVDENHFGPDQNCQRAQLAAFLYRYAQSQGKGFTGAWMFQLPFGDVPEWCYESVAWCYMNEIVTGYGDAIFGSSDDITREQVVTILYRFAVQVLGMDAVTMQELVSGCGDAGEVSDYAIPAMNWALANGIVQGADGDLMPGQSCTRAEIVTMLYRLLGE